MKSKTLMFGFFALFLIALVAASFTATPSTLTFHPGDASHTFTITNTDELTLLDISPLALSIEGEDSYIVAFDFTGDLTGIPHTTPSVITVTPSTEIDFSNFNLGETYSEELLIEGNGENQTMTIAIERDYCEIGEVGDLNIRRVEFDNKGKFGDDDEWYMFEEIEVEIKIENNGDEDIDDVVVEWGLYNKRTKEFIIDDDENDFNLDKDDDETITFSFEIDPDDFEEDDDENDFVFYVKAYSDDEGEENQCVSQIENIKIMRDDNFVVIGDIDFPEIVPCDEPFEVTAEIWNIGDDDEKDIYVIVKNDELSIHEKIQVDDLDIFDDDKISFELTIPEDAEEKTYGLIFEVYDDNNHIFENDDNDEAIFTELFEVSGGCKIPSSVDIDASLESDAVAGKETIVKIILTNTGSEQTTYQILVLDYNDWAELDSIEPNFISIDGGDSSEVIVTLTPNKDSEGDREFTVKTLFDENTDEQRISVPVEASQGFFPSITGFSIVENIKDNWFIWLVGLLNVVLVILIVVIAVKIARR